MRLHSKNSSALLPTARTSKQTGHVQSREFSAYIDCHETVINWYIHLERITSVRKIAYRLL